MCMRNQTNQFYPTKGKMPANISFKLLLTQNTTIKYIDTNLHKRVRIEQYIDKDRGKGTLG